MDQVQLGHELETILAGISDETLFGSMAFLAGVMGIMLLVMLLRFILHVICRWGLFSKAGEAGWKALIPVYAGVVEYSISWNWLFYIAFLVCMVVSYSMGSSGASSVISSVASLGVLVLTIIQRVKLAKSFGKGAGFAVGLLLLEVIFLPILAFGSSEYCGPNGDRLSMD